MMRFNIYLFCILYFNKSLVNAHAHGHGHYISHSHFESNPFYSSDKNDNFKKYSTIYPRSFRLIRNNNILIPSYSVVRKPIYNLLKFYTIDLILLDNHILNMYNYSHNCLVTLNISSDDLNKSYTYIVDQLNNNSINNYIDPYINRSIHNYIDNYISYNINVDCSKYYADLDFVCFILIICIICFCSYCCIALDSKKKYDNNLY